MKLKFFLAACLCVFASSAFAEQTEEQCNKNVNATIAGIEAMAQRNGTEPKIKDLSTNEIREIQKEKGSCAAQDVIHKRMR